MEVFVALVETAREPDLIHGHVSSPFNCSLLPRSPRPLVSENPEKCALEVGSSHAVAQTSLAGTNCTSSRLCLLQSSSHFGVCEDVLIFLRL